MTDLLRQLMNWWRSCKRCRGTGSITVAGEHYSKEWLREHQPATWVDIMVNGGWAAPKVDHDCPRCEGTGLR